MTYSIIGRDPGTGEVGIAVQSRWFAAGEDVAWIEPGVGAVCTQAAIDPSYGPRGLELMRDGRTAADALAELTAADEGRDLRQVAMLDPGGRFAQHTGATCVAAAGHTTGPDCCAQGNMLARDTCWGAMVAAFGESDGDLVDRLLAAVDAAEREGGDARGRQAARILVRPPRATGAPWDDRVIDIQVVDHPEPVPELRRLVRLKRAYDRLSRANGLATRGELSAAAEEASAAVALAPEDDQIAFWSAIVLAGAGKVDEAGGVWRDAVEANGTWPEFLRRCVAAGFVPPEAGVLADMS